MAAEVLVRPALVRTSTERFKALAIKKASHAQTHFESMMRGYHAFFREVCNDPRAGLSLHAFAKLVRQTLEINVSDERVRIWFAAVDVHGDGRIDIGDWFILALRVVLASQ